MTEQVTWTDEGASMHSNELPLEQARALCERLAAEGHSCSWVPASETTAWVDVQLDPEAV